MEPTVSVGRVVHYFNPNGEVHEALVVKVWDNNCINVVAWDANGAQYSASSVLRANSVITKGAWDWPQRV